MKKSNLLMGCMLMCASLASANGFTGRVNTFPPVLDREARTSQVAKAPGWKLNEDKADGIKMWAFTANDNTNDPAFVYFRSNKPYNLTKTGVIVSRDDDDFWYIHQFTAGTMYKGQFLGYHYKAYSMVNIPLAFIKVNLENGTWDTLYDMSGEDWNTNPWDFVEDMAVEPKTDQLKGLARSKEYNDDRSVTSELGDVDPETGELDNIVQLEHYYFSIEYDNNGVLWAMRWTYDKNQQVTGSCLVTLDPANNYKETKVCDLKKDGTPFYSMGYGLIQFDRATNDMYLLAAKWNKGADGNLTLDHQYLCTVDTKTGNLTSNGTFGFSDLGADFYIPAVTADAEGAAFRVSDLTSTFDENGTVTLQWKNPTTTWNKQDLTELAEVLVYRDGTDDAHLVATLPADNKVGETMTWTDNSATPGTHTYSIVPCRVKGEKGIADTWDAFTGRDVPSAPTDVQLKKNSETSVTLSWKAPDHGAHDGWFDKAGLKYTVTRNPGKVVVAKDITATTFTDDNLSELQSYSYVITPSTADGNGPEAASESVLAGAAETTPYATGFATAEEANVWTVVDGNQDGTKFAYRPSYGEDIPSGFTISTSSYGDNNDYVISPKLTLKGGHKYRVNFKLYFNYKTEDYDPERHHTFQFTAGQGATAEAQNIVLHKEDYFQNFNYHETVPFEMFFTPEKDGEYNVAFDYTSSQVQDDITLTYASVEEVFDTDLTALSFSGNTSVVKGTATDYNVEVKNVGGKAVDNYAVQIVRLDGNDEVVLGETAVDKALAPEATATVKVSATPDMEGAFKIAARVVAQGDHNTLNDLTAPTEVKAEKEGTVDFNYVLTDENQSTETRIPMSFYRNYYYSQSQSIYRADEFGISGSNVQIHRLAYEYDTNTPVTEPFDVTIYLGQTTDDSFTEGALDWAPLSDLTQVYAGQQTILPGNDNLMVFNFDTPFNYDPTKNLIVTVCKSNSDSESDFPARFHVYNNFWGDGYVLRTLRYESNGGVEAAPGDGIDIATIPVAHFAITGATGIHEVVLGSDAISFDGSAIRLKGIDAAGVKVFDLSGRTLFSQDVANGVTAVKANLHTGVYLIKVVSRDGKVYTRKINLKR